MLYTEKHDVTRNIRSRCFKLYLSGTELFNHHCMRNEMKHVSAGYSDYLTTEESRKGSKVTLGYMTCITGHGQLVTIGTLH